MKQLRLDIGISYFSFIWILDVCLVHSNKRHSSEKHLSIQKQFHSYTFNSTNIQTDIQISYIILSTYSSITLIHVSSNTYTHSIQTFHRQNTTNITYTNKNFHTLQTTKDISSISDSTDNFLLTNHKHFFRSSAMDAQSGIVQTQSPLMRCYTQQTFPLEYDDCNNLGQYRLAPYSCDPYIKHFFSA